jgi:hypothetical protein
MLSYIDPVLFPDECEILEVSANNYVYPIFKNGSSGLREKALRTLSAEQTSRVGCVTVYLRDPFERYISGVQTYLAYHPEFDRLTTLSLIEQYLFLDRHFALQFHWIVNLARHTKNIWMTFRSTAELDTAIGETWNTLARDQALIDRFQDHKRLWFYLQLDKILFEDLRDQTVTFSMITDLIRTKYPQLYEETIKRSQDLCAVLD